MLNKKPLPGNDSPGRALKKIFRLLEAQLADSHLRTFTSPIACGNLDTQLKSCKPARDPGYTDPIALDASDFHNSL